MIQVLLLVSLLSSTTLSLTSYPLILDRAFNQSIWSYSLEAPANNAWREDVETATVAGWLSGTNMEGRRRCRE
jgi:hypothetical protein